MAFVRAMQLILDRVNGSTFRMRVVTNRHAGMPRAVLVNVDRAYAALRLDADPDCELLLVDGNEVAPFDVDAPQRDHVIRRNRLDILMTGHRTFADGRPTFCNACNLSVVNSFGLAASYGDGADVFITGDSQQEQRQYALWVGRLARRLAPPTKPSQGNGVGRLLSHIDRLSQVYFTDIHGPGAAADVIEQRRVSSDVPDRLQFFSIYADTQYAAGDHLELLTGFLGFTFDDLAFSFTESDCGNPALMAHLRALKCERVFGRSYAEGMAEYVEFALGLMRRKDFPPDLVELMRARYEGPGAVSRMRGAADDYARETFGLTEEQLVCMAFSPFAGNGSGLAEFLQREHPGLLGRAVEIHALLADESEPAGELAAELERISGLELAQLRVLYRSSLRTPGQAGTDVIETVLVGDPHKATIRTRHTKDGPSTLEQISGR
ncbi:MAG: PqqD family protein [Micromonosporaceae bacterium]|nr:PqqD family protein [Micromonosporaceae bacterium]